ncbi:hypothetical protein CIFRMM251M_16680 [Citrobacter freundii]|uniref:hypothetical protein n=1 Tax=Citrobacter freundii TaxID=546 RepID=UPI001A1D623C|nr:hypothetical protein [Citrobacter freundii]
MNIKSITLGLALVVLSSSALAVDGYKGAKFGSSFEEFKKAKLCNWKKYTGENAKGVQSYYCDDFLFSGKNTLVFSIFINGQFKRLAISLNESQNITTIINSLEKKYGKPSTMFNAEDVASVEQNGGSLDMKFDNDTIIVGVKRDPSTKKDTSMLTYSSPDYFSLLGELDSKNVEGDL